MGERQRRPSDMTEMEKRRRRRELLRNKRKRELRRKMLLAGGILCLLLLLCLGLATAFGSGKKSSGKKTAEAAGSQAKKAAEKEAEADFAAALKEAETMAAMYDYDGALEKLKKITVSKEDTEGKRKIEAAGAEFEKAKKACIAYNVEEIPHVFFHSLLNDSRGFNPDEVGSFIAKDNGAWMCSVKEFNAIIQQMYDYGCVLVSMHDMVTESVDENGNVIYKKNENLMLPPGKTPVILSEDDLSYYHAYDGQGIAEKLVLDKDGKVKAVYTDESGKTLTGDYDMVPLLSTFIEKHPDFSYHNRHAMIAMTGYNGVFGYRTDEVYKTREEERLDDNQREWLEKHPDFDWDQDVAEAKKIAEALKKEGYEFASHTWGHLHADQVSLDALKKDDGRWKGFVEPIVGATDSIIFAHGSDIAGVEDYTMENEKFAFFKNAGYDFYANVDGSVAYLNQIRDSYVRTSRINLDGYKLYQAMNGNGKAAEVLAAVGIHDIGEFFDKTRLTPVEVTG